MSGTPTSIMLFAAGFGTRMGALTASTPKPLIRVAGKALLDHALDQVEAFGGLTIVANTHYFPDQIARHLDGKDVKLSHECPAILETGGGLRAALPMLGSGPVFTMNTDAIWAGSNPLAYLAARWDPSRMDALMLCVPRENAVGTDAAGDFLIDPEGRARRGPGAIYSGLQILKTDGLLGIDQASFSLNLLWDDMLRQGRLHAAEYPGKWCDVGTPQGIRQAEDMLGYGHV